MNIPLAAIARPSPTAASSAESIPASSLPRMSATAAAAAGLLHGETVKRKEFEVAHAASPVVVVCERSPSTMPSRSAGRFATAVAPAARS